ncbi:hypothetical protein KQH65_12590 [archaeon]|nr:hypothetical protein [archaeon]
MLKKWIPWRFLIQRTARAYGFIDPITFLARLRQFAQPSEVQEPIELIRAGIAFHARGLINTKAIQHNLDWLWPYWVEKQFNPRDESFIPRAFSFSHINLTHRNWTAVGHPELPLYPIVDPRGLITPLYDGWSIDFWVLSKEGALYPSREADVHQQWILSPNLAVNTRFQSRNMQLTAEVRLDVQKGEPLLDISASANAGSGGMLVAALRPYNPEGVQFIEKIKLNPHLPGWEVNSRTVIRMSEKPERAAFANYHQGDVVNRLDAAPLKSFVTCDVGMATSAALFRLQPGQTRSIGLKIGLSRDLPRKTGLSFSSDESWAKYIRRAAALDVPDEKIRFLYDAAIRTLVLMSAGDIYPGPYTYRRFWFRDACLMINALLGLGLTGRVYRLLNSFPARQKLSGYFHSQDGEWDSNGQVLWIIDRYYQLARQDISRQWMEAVIKGAEWIRNKRDRKSRSSAHYGLLPAGFSAEHLGPNDFYYWDDFWGLAGMRAAARLAGRFGSYRHQQRYEIEADHFARCIFASVEASAKKCGGSIPATPYRRMDAGAIGSMVADYPLQLIEPGDDRILKTAEFLMAHCFHKGAFFQDMIHSGLNVYLTLLRTGDVRYRRLIKDVAGLASPTGQWPEAIHPITMGGCMGDGQHAWAAAEWIMMIRHLFVREEQNALVLGSGIFPEWLKTEKSIGFGPTPTPYGPISVRFTPSQNGLKLQWNPDFPKHEAGLSCLSVRVPGYLAQQVTDFSIHYICLQEASAA